MRIRYVAMLALVVVLTSGCFLTTVFGREFAEDVSDFVDAVFTAIDTQATISICSRIVNTVSCQYFVDGVPVASTASLLSELGAILGTIADPIVLELPAAATNIRGTFDDGAGHSGDLLVYPKLSVVPIDDTRALTPGPGKQIVIVDLPADAPLAGATYDYQIGFEQRVPKGTGPTPIKAFLTGRLTVNGKTFYPPMFPCATSFASLPALTLPRAATLEPLALPQGLTGCVNTHYFYFRAESEHVGACDLDNDHDVDKNDIALIMAVRNTRAAAGDPRDINNDGVINANDARICTLRCTRPGCQA
jgi:hypothetical protein